MISRIIYDAANVAYKILRRIDASILSREDLEYILAQGEEECVVFESVTWIDRCDRYRDYFFLINSTELLFKS